MNTSRSVGDMASRAHEEAARLAEAHGHVVRAAEQRTLAVRVRQTLREVRRASTAEG